MCFSDITNVEMAGELRERSNSFDLHDIKGHHHDHGDGAEAGEHGHHHFHFRHHHGKPSFLVKLIRSLSETSMRKKSPSASPATSPKNSPKPTAVRRRRFVRVIKNDDQVGEEYVNPHVVRKYEQGFWESKYMRKSASLDEPQRPLPYTVSGNTILKKAHSIDSAEPSPAGTPPLSAKSCKFNEDVEVVEYDIKGKCLMIMNDAHVSHEKLHEENLCCLDEQEFLQVVRGDVSEANDKLEALEVIDENNALSTDNSEDDSEEHLLDDVLVDDIKDSVFASDSSETESATESCDDCEKNIAACRLEVSECSEEEDSASMHCSPPAHAPRPPTPPTTRRQNSDEGISAPKKSKFAVQTATAAAAARQAAAVLVTAEH